MRFAAKLSEEDIKNAISYWLKERHKFLSSSITLSVDVDDRTQSKIVTASADGNEVQAPKG